MTIRQELKAILDDITMEDVNFDRPEASLKEVYGMNSMDAVDMADRIESTFAITVETEMIDEIQTIGDVVSFVESKLKVKQAQKTNQVTD